MNRMGIVPFCWWCTEQTQLTPSHCMFATDADMKLGIFIHWGVFSVPSYGTEWFWHNYACSKGTVRGYATASVFI